MRVLKALSDGMICVRGASALARAGEHLQRFAAQCPSIQKGIEKLIQMNYATISRRVIAYLIDSALVFFVFIVIAQSFIFVPLRHLIIGSEDWFRSGWNTESYTLLTMSLPIWLYFSLFEVSPWQATVGKHVLSLKTLDQTSGDRVSAFRAFVRTLVKLAPWEIAHLTNNLPVPMWYDAHPGFRIGFIVVPVLVLLYAVMGTVTPKRQSLHDLIAQTVVIYHG